MTASSSQGISGSLQDVAVADVLQFVHLGRRTGLLLLRSGQAQARVGFVRGKITFAEATGAPRLGDLLLRLGLLDRRSLEAALAARRQTSSHQRLGQHLLQSGLIKEADLRAAVEEQIRRAIALILGWETGDFEFLPEEMSMLEDGALYPSDLIPELDLDTGSLLLQASQIFEEKSRQDQLSPVTPKAPEILTSEELERVLAKLDTKGGSAPGVVQVITPDEGFSVRLAASLRNEGWEARRVAMEDLGGGPGVIVLDCRQGILGPPEVTRIHQSVPQVPMVVVVQLGQPIAPFLRAGAAMVVPPELEAIVLAVASLSELSQEKTPVLRTEEPVLERLRQAFGELRSGFVAASMALHLLRILSETVARAMLLAVKEQELVVLGAFGRDARGELLASSSRGLRVAWASGDLLQRAAATGEVVRGSHAHLPQVLQQLLGPAARDEVVVFPVRGLQRVLALAVADNGDKDAPIAHWEIVELAAEQAGMAFENELLRRKLVEKAASH